MNNKAREVTQDCTNTFRKYLSFQLTLLNNKVHYRVNNVVIKWTDMERTRRDLVAI